MAQQEKTMAQQNKTELTIGFMPLSDCAPLVVAQKLGLFEQQGLAVKLERQNSWATLRDKLLAGYLDMAQMLAPMPLAMHLGLGNVAEKMSVPMILSYNGNGITLSTQLFSEVLTANSALAQTVLAEPMSASLLKPIVEQRKSAGLNKLSFATVFPYSCHYYQLAAWLYQGGISLEDVDIRIIPPSGMVQAMGNNEIDGFCVGSPWNAVAVRAGIGVTVIASREIWHNTPEKVLGVTNNWQLQHPQTLLAVTRALGQACQWLTGGPNRFEAARWLSEAGYVGAELENIAPALLDSCLTQQGSAPREVQGHTIFHQSQQHNQADREQGIWLLQQMQRCSHLDASIDLQQVVSQVY
ncbi:CmpA/NrtA family ABC transporter substrate-binding protein [Planctobacterium marinum]|uniref:Nitrate ABC transporter, nitrate-binding protein n=1 Tax=Planctobacterium marinum TaxID=1631968 RepID=A0AA48HNR5_9ALTE|nr:hypothetical protein MACH26_41250 [Planctobacterium marinum]